jgi:hypothetical protein
MANVLNSDKKIAVIGALSEGSRIRSIVRITGVHPALSPLTVVRSFITQEIQNASATEA